jgi:hypothetical protein
VAVVNKLQRVSFFLLHKYISKNTHRILLSITEAYFYSKNHLSSHIESADSFLTRYISRTHTHVHVLRIQNKGFFFARTRSIEETTTRINDRDRKNKTPPQSNSISYALSAKHAHGNRWTFWRPYTVNYSHCSQNTASPVHCANPPSSHSHTHCSYKLCERKSHVKMRTVT